VLQVSEAQSNSTKHLLPQVLGIRVSSTKGKDYKVFAHRIPM